MHRLVRTGLAATRSAISHLSWWVDWHTRARPCDGGRPVEDAADVSAGASRAA